MTALPTQNQFDWARILSSVGQGFMAAGAPGGGWSAFGPATMNAQQAYDASQMNRRRFNLLEEEARRDQERFEEEQRLANTEAAERKRLMGQWEALLGNGPMAGGIQTTSRPGPMGRSSFVVPASLQAGPMAGAAAAKSLSSVPSGNNVEPMQFNPFNLTPQQRRFLAIVGPERGMDLMGDRIFSEPEQFKPNLTTFYEGDQQYQGYLDPNNKPVRVTPNSPRWAPRPEAGGLSVDINGDGTPDIQMGNIKNEWQSKDNAFANRLDNAIVGMDGAEMEGYDPTAATAGGVADYIGQRSIGGLIGNAMTSDQGKLWYRNAKEALAVILRKDTGAAVTPQEFELYGPLYLPMPWDDPQTKASKKHAMLVMRDSLRQGIGQAPLQPPPTGAPAPTAPGTPAGSPDDPLNLFPQQ